MSESELYDREMVRSRVDQLASDLEDWVCETTFGWGQQRNATVPEIHAPDL